MSIRLHNVVADRATVTVTYGPEVGSVTYRPNVLTSEFLTRAEEVQENGGTGMASLIVEWICTVVADWDVEDEAGKIPIVPDRVAKLPVVFLLTVISAVSQHVQEPLSEGEDGTSAAT